ncbi:MAG: DUF418 domain-containing protein [Planctomycetota bacterium]
MTDLPPSPVAPAERQLGLDVVRGLAVLGILAMNIVEFGLPMRAYGDPSAAGGSTGADLCTWLVQEALFDGRMRALFSMLFGAGMVLIAERMQASDRGVSTADLLLRRCLWLIPLGIVHRFFLQWTGDILYIYGLLGVLAVGLRELRPRTQLIAGLLALAMAGPLELRRYDVAATQRAQAAEAQAIEARGEKPAEELAQAAARWQRRLEAPKPDADAAELKAIRGSWVDVARFRWDHNHSFQHAFVYYYFVWDVLGMMLVGMALQRLGFFAGRMRTSVYAAAIVVGAAAATTSWWLAQTWAASSWSRGELGLQLARGSLYPFLRGFGGLGWAAVLLLALRSAPLARLLQPLAAVGRTAFSCYILQTLCCTTFFFGWGCGWYGLLSRTQLMLVFGAVSVVQLVFAVLWLRAFRFGPMEWLWRSLTYWHRQPLCREASPAAAATPAATAPPSP